MENNMKNIMYLFIISTLLLSTNLSFSQEFYSPQIIAGSKDDFMFVQYYKIKGTNYEIGKKIVEIAKIMHMDIDQVSLTLQSEDLKEGIASFFERREGNYKGD